MFDKRLSFTELKEFFEYAEDEEEKASYAQFLVDFYPEETWLFFRERLRGVHFFEAIDVLKLFRDRRTIALFIELLLESTERLNRAKKLLDVLLELNAWEALLRLLEDPFIIAPLRCAILEALSSVQDKRLVPLFLKELNSPHRSVQSLAIRTLGRWKVAEAAPILCRQLRLQRQTSLRPLIVEALAHIATNEALVGLQELLLHEDELLRLETAQQIARFPNNDFLPLLHACLATFGTSTEAHGKIQRAIQELEKTLTAEFQRRIQPFVREFEIVLFQ